MAATQGHQTMTSPQRQIVSAGGAGNDCAGTDAVRDARFVAELEGALADLRRYARYLSRDDIEGDEIVQAACLRAWSSRGRWDAQRPLRGWLFRIARNAWIDRCQSGRRDPLISADDFYLTAASPSAIEARSALLDVERHLDGLAPVHRDVVLLCLVLGLSHAEVAALLDCNEQTVRTRLHRARRALGSDVAVHAPAAASPLPGRVDERLLAEAQLRLETIRCAAT